MSKGRAGKVAAGMFWCMTLPGLWAQVAPEAWQVATEARQAGHVYFREQDYASALQAFQRAADLGLNLREDGIMTLKMGMAHFRAGHFGEAQRYLQLGRSLRPELRPYVDYFLLQCLLELKDYDGVSQAVMQFRRMHGKHALADDTFLVEAQMYEALDNWSGATLMRENHFQRHQQSAAAPALEERLVRNYFHLGNVERALDHLRNLVRRSPEAPATLQALQYLEQWWAAGAAPTEETALWTVQVRYRQGEYAEAETAARRALEQFPTGASIGEFRLAYGQILYRLSRFRDALTHLRPAADGPFPVTVRLPARLFTARSHLALEQFDAAVAVYQRIVDEYPMHPSVAEVLWKLGWMYEGRREFDKAKQYYRMNTRTVNDYREPSQWRMAFCDYKSGAYAAAAAAFQGIADVRRTEDLAEGARYWQGRALERLGRRDAARAVYQQLTDAPGTSYYTQRARQRLRRPLTFPPALAILGAADDAPPDEGPGPELQTAVWVNEIFGREFGAEALRAVEIRFPDDGAGMAQLSSAYERAGLYDRALRVGIRLRTRFYSTAAAADARAVYERVYPRYFAELVARSVADGPLEPELVMALIRRESAFDDAALSAVGAIGLMQLMPHTARQVAAGLGRPAPTVFELRRPVTNIRLGTANFELQLRAFKNFRPAALAAYNAGPDIVTQWIERYGTDDEEEFIENLEYAETRSYVRGVLHDYWLYRALYRPE